MVKEKGLNVIFRLYAQVFHEFSQDFLYYFELKLN